MFKFWKRKKENVTNIKIAPTPTRHVCGRCRKGFDTEIDYLAHRCVMSKMLQPIDYKFSIRK